MPKPILWIACAILAGCAAAKPSKQPALLVLRSHGDSVEQSILGKVSDMHGRFTGVSTIAVLDSWRIERPSPKRPWIAEASVRLFQRESGWSTYVISPSGFEHALWKLSDEQLQGALAGCVIKFLLSTDTSERPITQIDGCEIVELSRDRSQSPHKD